MQTQFNKAHPEGSDELKKYKMMNRAESAKFRLERASKTSKEVEMKYSHKKILPRVDEKQGDCWPLGRLVVELGGGKHPDAINGAMNVANFCTRLGGDWLHVHPQSGLVEFFYLHFKYNEKFSEALCYPLPRGPCSVEMSRVTRLSRIKQATKYIEG